MNIDIRIATGFYDHHKTIRLEKKLGFEGIKALHRLWFYAAEYRPNGHLTNMDDEDIASVCKWDGDIKQFIGVLSHSKYPWLDWEEDHYYLHNWEKRNGYAAHSEERSEKARRASLARWDKRNGNKKQKDNAKCINEHKPKAMLEKKQANAPSPAPTPSPNPYPTLQYITLKEWPNFVDKCFSDLLNDPEWIEEQKIFRPELDIQKTMELEKKFWAGKAGWHKKNKGNPGSDWKRTLRAAFGPKGINRVFNPKNNGHKSGNHIIQNKPKQDNSIQILREKYKSTEQEIQDHIPIFRGKYTQYKEFSDKSIMPFVEKDYLKSKEEKNNAIHGQ